MPQSERGADGLRAGPCHDCTYPRDSHCVCHWKLQKIAVGRNSAAFTTSFIHFAERMSLVTSTVPAWRRHSAASFSRPRVDPSNPPIANQEPLGGVLPHHDTRFEHVRGHLNHSAKCALGPDDRGDVVHCHAVLHADDRGHPVLLVA